MVQEQIAERERLAGNVPSKLEATPRFESNDHDPAVQKRSEGPRDGFDTQDSFEQGL